MKLKLWIHTYEYVCCDKREYVHVLCHIWLGFGGECRVFALHYSSHTIGYEVLGSVIGVLSEEKVHFRVNDDGYVCTP